MTVWLSSVTEAVPAPAVVAVKVDDALPEAVGTEAGAIVPPVAVKAIGVLSGKKGAAAWAAPAESLVRSAVTTAVPPPRRGGRGRGGQHEPGAGGHGAGRRVAAGRVRPGVAPPPVQGGVHRGGRGVVQPDRVAHDAVEVGRRLRRRGRAGLGQQADAGAGEGQPAVAVVGDVVAGEGAIRVGGVAAKAMTATPMLLPLMVLLLTVAVPSLEEDALEAVALQGIAADLDRDVRFAAVDADVVAGTGGRPADDVIADDDGAARMTGGTSSMRMPVAWVSLVGSGPLPRR